MSINSEAKNEEVQKTAVLQSDQLENQVVVW